MLVSCSEISITYWNYQCFLSAWGDLTCKVFQYLRGLKKLLARGGQYPDWHHTPIINYLIFKKTKFKFFHTAAQYMRKLEEIRILEYLVTLTTYGCAGWTTPNECKPSLLHITVVVATLNSQSMINSAELIATFLKYVRPFFNIIYERVN